MEFDEIDEIFCKTENGTNEDQYFEINFDDDDDEYFLQTRIEELQIQLNDIRKRKDELLKRRQQILNPKSAVFKQFSVKEYFSPYIENDGMSAPQLICDRPSTEFRQEAILSTYFSLKNCEREFTDVEQSIVLSQTRSQMLKRRMNSFLCDLDSLSTEYYRTKDENISERIQEINLEIEKLKSSHSDVQPEPFDEQIDWAIIAKNINFNLRRSGPACRHYYNNFLCSKINKSKWTEDENILLIDLFKEFGNDWDKIAAEIGNGRLAWQCCKQYQSLLNPDSIRIGKFDPNEKKRIYDLIEKSKFPNGEINWTLIRILCETRSIKQIRALWYNDKESGQLAKYSKLEDKMIIMGNKLFRGNWIKIAEYFPARKNKQLRERFANFLNFTTRKLAYWTKEEDEKLIELSKKYRKSRHQELIDLARIQKESFPDRNLHQIYRRCVNLFDSGMIDVNPRYKMTQFSKGLTSLVNRLQRRADERVQIVEKVPIDRATLKEQFLCCHEILVSQHNKQSSPMTNNEMKRFYHSMKSESIGRLYEGFTEDQIDGSLTMFANILKHRLRLTCYRPDENSSEILGHALIEAIDSGQGTNLNKFCRLHAYNQQHSTWSLDDCIKFTGKRQYCVNLFPFTIDLARLYLSNYTFGISFDSPDSALKIPFVPGNASTIFAYACLQTLSNGLIVQLAKQDDHNKMLQHEKQSEDYKNLRRTFFSLFALPALMSTQTFQSSHIATKFEAVTEQDEEPIDDGAGETAAAEPQTKRKQGRPNKKKFSHSVDKFVRNRSIKHRILMKNQIHDDIDEQNVFSELIQDSQQYTSKQKWTKDAQYKLLNRATMFLNFIEKVVDEKQNSAKTNDSPVKPEDRKIIPRQRKKPDLTNVRRSSRSSKPVN